jgi:tetratricopeptide (TPR) repeat protein
VKPRTAVAIITAILALAAVLYFARRATRLPEPGTDAYEQVTRAFYHGLAALEVGLLDDARMQFRRATEIVAEEPASWANLGVAQLRLGELDAAAEPIARALTLEPDNASLLLLAGRMEIARGRLDEGIAHLRRAVEQDAAGLRTRFAFAEEIERAGGPDGDRDALALLDELLQRAPENAAVIIERARVAAKAGDAQRLNDSVTRLEKLVPGWPATVGEQFKAFREAVAAANFALAGRATLLMRNLLSAVPSFRESLSEVRTPTELVADPIDRFVRLEPPPATPSPPDRALRFEREAAPVYGRIESLIAEGAVALDWNNDFRPDVVRVLGGVVSLFLEDPPGFLKNATPSQQPAECGCTAAWPADVEMDGDLDIVAARENGNPVVLRNNGSGEPTQVEMFAGVDGARAFAWADLDRDADPDAVFLDRMRRLHVFANRQAGDFVPVTDVPALPEAVALGVGDLDADGVFDVITLHANGALRVTSRANGGWETREIAMWQSLPGGPAGGYRLLVADLDNNGALDVIASGTATRIWIADEMHRLQPLESDLAATIVSVGDFNADGRLDLLGGGRYLNRGSLAYHWKVIRPRATTTTGDQRINSFGVGGEIEVRSGLLRQKQLLTGDSVHIGLGGHSAIDVARIVWPNGVAQAEFGVGVDDALVAEQRLKGSCPWVFAWDGTRMAFVTDFLWRSPLGLRINAQDTAGVVQTEDWVRIRGDQLTANEGAYDVRITAELWETHFFDHVSLMVVDHPVGTEVYVDERFSASRPPAYAVHAVRDVRPVTQARDHRGRDVTDLVGSLDGNYLATFERGRYQGIAEEHFVEFDGPGDGRPMLIASGWIYPTDSSINVAIGQGGQIRPMGLSLEAQQADGGWKVIEPDLGFPAGKNKTILVDLSRAGAARRLRLRTNLEIYWDSLAFGETFDASIDMKRLPAASADLRYRGFSETTSPRGESPETPHYDRIANRTPRWRDLEGYHTRFGDVKELLESVDDRYVIMNAGDEMRIRFPEQPAPRAGWRRDFVLIGDGWEKDGDYNTGFSQTVLPLPSHDTPNYGAGVKSLALDQDPVYQRHRADWETYHTRYVTPETFTKGLRRH